MKRVRAITVILLILYLLIYAGCSVSQQQKSAGQVGCDVTDSQGVTVKLPARPQRIVSLSIATDEILMELVPIDRIAAVTYLADDSGISNITEEAKQVNTKIRANAEAVIALNPDLVLIADWQPKELVQSMRDAGLPVYVFQSARNIEQVRKNITDIAAVVGEPDKGAALVLRMDSMLAEIAARVEKIPDTDRQVVARFSNMGGSGGIGSTFDDICRHAGVKNAAAMAGLDMNGTLTKEQLIKINPDLILLPTWDYTGKQDFNKYKEEIQSDPGLQTVKAVQQRRLVQVPDRYLFCTSHHIVKGVLGVAQASYPQLFSQQ